MHKVALDSVSYSYGKSEVLRDITFTAATGDFICLLGPSGCGKSTLLRMLAGLAIPTSGRITLGGNPISGPGLDRGVVFQNYSLFPWMTTGQNIVLAMEQAFPGKTGTSTGGGKRLSGACRTAGRLPQVAGSAFRRHASAGRHCQSFCHQPAGIADG